MLSLERIGLRLTLDGHRHRSSTSILSLDISFFHLCSSLEPTATLYRTSALPLGWQDDVASHPHHVAPAWSSIELSEVSQASFTLSTRVKLFQRSSRDASKHIKPIHRATNAHQWTFLQAASSLRALRRRQQYEQQHHHSWSSTTRKHRPSEKTARRALHRQHQIRHGQTQVACRRSPQAEAPEHFVRLSRRARLDARSTGSASPFADWRGLLYGRRALTQARPNACGQS